MGGFFSSLLESIAYEYDGYLGILRSLLPALRPREIRVVGGGARSRLWTQIKADVLGIPYVRLEREDQALMGSALIAARAAGVIDSVEQAAREWVQSGGRVEADRARHRAYEPYRTVYGTVTAQLQPVFRSMASARERATLSE